MDEAENQLCSNLSDSCFSSLDSCLCRKYSWHWAQIKARHCLPFWSLLSGLRSICQAWVSRKLRALHVFVLQCLLSLLQTISISLLQLRALTSRLNVDLNSHSLLFFVSRFGLFVALFFTLPRFYIRFLWLCLSEFLPHHPHPLLPPLPRPPSTPPGPSEEKLNLDESEWEDIHVITGALKLFFRELPEPLVPFGFFTDIVETVSEWPASAPFTLFGLSGSEILYWSHWVKSHRDSWSC